MADRSLIVVNYRSAALCREAVESARASSAEPLEIVIVDNSCDPEEARELGRIGAERLVVAPSNLGYAAGANAGIAASSGAVVIVSNPDIVFGAGCVDRLAGSLGRGVALAGPRFSWDRASEWLLPPAELMTMRGEISRRLAARSASRSARRSTRRFFERLSFWRMTAPTRVAAVSGAVMAIEKSAWKRVGGFDERYRLYYEEIDFMRALAREGLGVLHVPDARCRHLYDQSAAGAAEHREKFAESEALYLRKWHGATASLLGLLEGGRGFGLPPAALLGRSEAFAIPASPEAHVVEASPLESFDTAAGHFAVSGDARIPAEILESYHGGALFVRVVEAATGREVSRRVLRDSA